MAATTVRKPSTDDPQMPSSAAVSGQSGWESLYRIGAVSAVIPVVLTVVQIAVFVSNPPPSTVVGWFALFQTNRLVALIDFDLLLMVDWALFIPIYLALYVALRQTNPSLSLLSVVLAAVAVAAFMSSNTSLNMLALSNQYAAATTDA